MRIGLTGKLLLVLGLTSTLSVVGMGLAARWSFQHGFLDYLGQQELKRITPVADALLEAYREQGSWNFVADNPGAWPRLVDDAMAPKIGPGVAKSQAVSDRPSEDAVRSQVPPMRRDWGPPGPFGEPGLGPPNAPPFDDDFAFPPPDRPGQPGRTDAARLAPAGMHPSDNPRPPPGFRPPPRRNKQLLDRLRLLDAARNQIAGHIVGEIEGEVLSPLIVDDAVVGWLGLSSPIWLEDELAQRFNRQHNRSLLWISLTALTLALMLGAILGTRLLRRIRAVAAGARQLTKGDYGARVLLKGRDELTELAQDFNHLALALERSETLRRGAMADVSHELRTPLAVARAELDALIDGIRPCTKARLEQLHGRLMTLGCLLDDLYDLALSDSGALNYRFEPLDLSAILRAAVADREASCADKEIALQLQIEDGLRMDGDAGRLRQVLDNLLANSLRYSDAGGFIRMIAARTNDQILISIADTPPGVEHAALERLFDRFYRVEASRSRAKGGAGLGLAICRSIVEAHRGSILARPADCGGLEIQIRFSPIPNSTLARLRLRPTRHANGIAIGIGIAIVGSIPIPTAWDGRTLHRNLTHPQAFCAPKDSSSKRYPTP
ncbi:HAMP domain-containing protein [Thiorhodococcus mannitoliphagus]|uniref:histidine kinase n=1 Tax=Thiorhodococcus mannitoliphagus TaxID=329406 RepID=A0A6P1DWZ7_9GAMM|nr:ATP-binding protein [Thiorhodococcus mannitoliphagus]NEX20175.1 HAMP domain-containing protein [Thiorhodococcus mannitoliphagus]